MHGLHGYGSQRDVRQYQTQPFSVEFGLHGQPEHPGNAQAMECGDSHRLPAVGIERTVARQVIAVGKHDRRHLPGQHVPHMAVLRKIRRAPEFPEQALELDFDGGFVKDDAPAFHVLRPRLQKIAYRMLGTVADADDIVQDVWLRWHEAPGDEIDNADAWLVAATTRLSIDRLRAARIRREDYAGI